MRDLNKACPKDDFHMLFIEMTLDATTRHEALSFMLGSSGSNQIKTVPDNAVHRAFRKPKGVYCYRVMPFGLKNPGATYQRAMTVIFSHLLHKDVDCYVDDIVVKTARRQDHLQSLCT